jgi:hypothetical protein
VDFLVGAQGELGLKAYYEAFYDRLVAHFAQ